jgi:hypothetical protein
MFGNNPEREKPGRPAGLSLRQKKPARSGKGVAPASRAPDARQGLRDLAQ